VDQARPIWLPIDDLAAHIEKTVGAEPRLVIYEIKRALLKGDARALERAVATTGDGYKERELPPEFWQTAKLSYTHDAGGPRLFVRYKEREPGFCYRYFVRQTDRKLWPLADEQDSPTGDAQQAQGSELWPRKSVAGRKSQHDWEKILIRAAVHMHVNSVPEGLAELCREAESWFRGEPPGKTQLESHLGPLHKAFKRADGK
jgi:hypothetical protein